MNVERLKAYKDRLIVFPRKAGKPKKGDSTVCSFFDLADDFGCFLAFVEVDEVAFFDEHVFVAVLDECEDGEVHACKSGCGGLVRKGREGRGGWCVPRKGIHGGSTDAKSCL